MVIEIHVVFFKGDKENVGSISITFPPLGNTEMAKELRFQEYDFRDIWRMVNQHLQMIEVPLNGPIFALIDMAYKRSNENRTLHGIELRFWKIINYVNG
jgi:hypothetical protein